MMASKYLIIFMSRILVCSAILLEKQLIVEELPQPDHFSQATKTIENVTSKSINAVRQLDSKHRLFLSGAINHDLEGERTLEILQDDFGIDTSLIRFVDTPTGQAIVITNQNGETLITIYLGASQFATYPNDLTGYDFLYLDTSLPLDKFYSLLSEKPKNLPVFLDIPNQIDELDQTYFKYIDFLAPNRQEAEQLAKQKINSKPQAVKVAELLKSKTKGTVILTLDKDGCLIYQGDSPTFLDTKKVDKVDDTGAGDIFRGVFVDEYLKTGQIIDSAQEALKWATKSVKIQGVDKSIKQIKKLRKQR